MSILRALSRLWLVLTCAATVCTREGILAFANRYGLLGEKARRYIDQPRPEDESKKTLAEGEALEVWIEEIQSMNEVTRLWDLAAAGDVENLAPYIEWRESEVRYNSHPALEAGSPPPHFPTRAP